MREVLPGKPQANLQAVCTGSWEGTREGTRLIAYISGNALIILGGADKLLQTIYHNEREILGAVAIDEESGKIAVCSRSITFVYKPYGREQGVLKWSLQCSIAVHVDGDMINSLSWGSSEELLTGSSYLTLLSTSEGGSARWQRKLANPAKYAQFSYDASLIASTGQHDRLMKIWRRLSYGSDDVQFDFTYLQHPMAITGMHWRRPYHREQIIDIVLYTFCADHKLRVWAATDPHALQILQLWSTIDMEESIKPRLFEPVHGSSERFAFIIDSRDFIVATERAVEGAEGGEKEQHGLEHLIEVANRSPEVCVVLDDRGHMSAWGLENVGCKARKTTNIFNIAHIEGLNLNLGRHLRKEERHVQYYSFCGDQPSKAFTILAHHFDGRIDWMEAKVDEFFDPSPRQHRWTMIASWTGHTAPIKKIVRTISGQALISRTNDNDGLVWRQRITELGPTLIRHCSIHASEHIHRTSLLDEGKFVVFLHHESVSLWDCRGYEATRIASCNYDLTGKPLCLVLLPHASENSRTVYVATISSRTKGIVWEARMPSLQSVDSIDGQYATPLLQEFCRFEIDSMDDIAFVLPVDPAGSPSDISGFFDTFAKDIAISYTNGGALRCWTAKIDVGGRSVQWLLTSNVETGVIKPSLASGSSIRKAALVDVEKTQLTIWDTRCAQLEFEERFEAQDVIQDLDWSSTPDNQSILAVGFPHRVIFLSQLRYDYLDAGRAWEMIREIRTRDLTPHPIGDSIWLGSGNLVIAAGNQLFVYDKKVEITDNLVTDLRLPSHQSVSNDLFDIVTRLNGPLPVFHPQFLSQCILSGKTSLVQKILIGLWRVLRFYSDGEQLDSFLDIALPQFYNELEASTDSTRKEMRSSYADFSDEEEETEAVTENIAASMIEKLARISLPQLSSREQFHLADIVECVATLEKHCRSIDDYASRFLLFFRQHCLRKSHQARSEQVDVSWREIVWAYHSGSQDILADLVSRQYGGRMLWEHTRESGMLMWMTDLTALRAQFEVIARNEYTKTYEKNPVDCSLYYMALRKKNVLIGLWRMAAWNREQGSTQRFLANNFQEAKWKTAALKNAYALLGKRRFEYAAAFFLLADKLKDAVSVCWNQMQDLQLAISICRVYEGDDGLVLKGLLEDQVLPRAAREGNRWLATWAFWMLNRRDMAVRALISPIYTLLETPESPRLEAKSFLTNDPALVILYRQLRQKTLQTLQGASKISSRIEWEFVLNNAQLYDRMGCDLLALDLVRNWEFLKQLPELKKPFEEHPDLRKMLRRRSSAVVADLPIAKEPSEMWSGSGNRPPTSVFEEPNSNSLLDNFGF